MPKLVLALCMSLVLVTACKKYDGPEPKEEKPKPAAVEEKAPPAPAEPEEKPEPTFAENAQAFLADLGSGVDSCLSDYMNKMDMSKLEDGFLPINLNRMDKACREPIETYKRRSEAFLGQLPELDALLRPMAVFADSYLRMSFKFKQLGSPERWKVVAAIEENRAKALQAAAEVLRSAEAIKAWPADRAPDTTVMPADLDAAMYKARSAELAAWLIEHLSRFLEDYRTYGFQPAEVQESIYYFSFRYAYYTTKRAYELGKKRFLALRCNGGKDCARVGDDMRRILESADKVVEGYKTGLNFYRGDYFKRLDDAMGIEKDMAKHLKAMKKAVKKARLGR